MARLRNSSRNSKRLASRLLVGAMLVACAGFAVYQFDLFGGGDPVEADAGSTDTALAKVAPDTSSDWDQSAGGNTDANIDGNTDAPAEPVVGGESPDTSATPAEQSPAIDEEIADTGKADPMAGDDAWTPALPKPAATFMKDAQAHMDRGELLQARTVLNDALQSGTLDRETDLEVKQKMRDLNRVIVFTPTKRFKDDPYQAEYTVGPGDLLSKIVQKEQLYIPYGFLERVNATTANRIRVGQTLKTVKGPIHAVVSKSHFEMDLYLQALPGKPGSMYLTTYKVGLGEDSSTPTGLWEVTLHSKLKNPEWTNPRTSEVYKADDPKNPLGERWLGLTGIAGDAIGQPSYGIHGTIFPETIGTNASMGCIRLVHDDIVEVYDMLYETRSTVLVVD